MRDWLTFAPTGELDSDALVDVLGEVEDGLALRLVHCRLGAAWEKSRGSTDACLGMMRSADEGWPRGADRTVAPPATLSLSHTTTAPACPCPRSVSHLPP